mmetsp:Transcript_30171/g.89603  ORF Transcript_30171/g.89603 Transcript_30171/m.89603 type:complete len:226 (+) Transcript_30171:49-726(+)
MVLMKSARPSVRNLPSPARLRMSGSLPGSEMMSWSKAQSGITKTGLSASPRTFWGLSPAEWYRSLPTALRSIFTVICWIRLIHSDSGTYSASSTPKTKGLFGVRFTRICHLISQSRFLPAKCASNGPDLSGVLNRMTVLETQFSFSTVLGSPLPMSTSPCSPGGLKAPWRVNLLVESAAATDEPSASVFAGAALTRVRVPSGASHLSAAAARISARRPGTAPPDA